MTNCPNCGAPVRGHQCECCETVVSNDAPVADKIELLKAKNAYLERTDALKKLYEDAINAIRVYGRV